MLGRGNQIDLYKRVEGEHPFGQVKHDGGEFRNLLVVTDIRTSNSVMVFKSLFKEKFQGKATGLYEPEYQANLQDHRGMSQVFYYRSHNSRQRRDFLYHFCPSPHHILDQV